MQMFSCFLPKAGNRGTRNSLTTPAVKDAPQKVGIVLPLETVNGSFLKLLHSLSLLEGGGLPVLFDACQATCDYLEAEQVCICLLGADQSATVVACAGVDGELALGRRQLPGALATMDGPLMTAVLQMYEAAPASPFIFRDAAGRHPTACDASAESWASGRIANFVQSLRLPYEWQQLHMEHECQQFAAAPIVAAGAPIGFVSLAAKGSSRPTSWTPEALQSVAMLLSGHVQQQQVHVLVDALHQLHVARTISQVVAAVGEAAVEAATAVAHVQGNARVALLQPDASAAAIFQQQRTSDGANGNSGYGRRASCEYVMSGASSRKSFVARPSLDAAGLTAKAAGANTALIADSSRGNSFTDAWSAKRARARLSFTMPSDKGASCKGHTLPISGTLLAEALSREASGLCVSDCASYVQDKKAFPRDAVLSRDAAMPVSLALATINPDGKPLLALYLAYSCSLPQPLLQAVVQRLQQLLQAVLPILKSKIEGDLKPEWDYLRMQLEETSRRKGYEPTGGATGNTSQSDHEYVSATAAAECGGPTAPGGGGRGAKDDYSGEDVTLTLRDGLQPSNPNHSDAPAGSPFTTVASPIQAACGPAGAQRRHSLLGPTRSEGPNVKPSTRPNSGVRRLLGMQPSEGYEGASTGAPWLDGGSGSDGSGRGPSSLPNHARLGVCRSVSFRLEAARSPRGASRLAPIITIMHDRLKAAQAAQMTGGRSEARQADLQSLKLMQEVGKGGYGTVYRGTYHGSEVAIKVIQEKELAALQSVNGDIRAPCSSVVLHKQHLHDAIELVASVSVSHPNIVQVLTFFTDCKLQLMEPSTLFDSMEVSEQAAHGARLVHMPSLLESPAPGQDIAVGGISVALVMEFMDAGSLSDAIQKRVFFERLDTSGVAGGRAGKGLLAVSMRAVYSTLLEVALALRHMHSLHLVHCDLKPQNVLLKSAPRDPRGFTSKLSDFGLAKTLAHNEEGQLVIDEAVGSGTITHIAPEVFMGKKTLGAAVDIYAFGIMMFQVLCGMRLYDGMSAQEIANAVSHRMLRPTLPQWVPANYRGLAERCWHQLPSVRPTADELVRQLEKLSDFKRRNQRPQSGYQQ